MRKKIRTIPGTLPGERQARRDCYLTHRDLFDLNDDLLRQVIKMTSETQVVPRDFSKTAAAVILGLYTKACKTFRAIQVLCRFGLGEDALNLLRVLIETLVNMRYIGVTHKGLRERRAQKFAFHGAIWKQKYLLAAERDKIPVTSLSQSEKDELARIVEYIKQEYGKEEFKKMSKSHQWDGVSMADMAKKVELQSLYHIAWRSSSESAHARDIREHIGYREKKGFFLKIMPGEGWLEPVLWVSNIVFFGIVDKADELFQLGWGETREGFSDRLKKLHAGRGQGLSAKRSIHKR